MQLRLLLLGALFVTGGCDDGGSDESSDAGPDAGDGGPTISIDGAPLLYAPTAQGITINVVTAGDREQLRVEIRESGDAEWGPAAAGNLRGDDVVEWEISGLESSAVHEYRLSQVGDDGQGVEIHSAEFVTRRDAGEQFTFDLLTDSHIFARDFTAEELEEYPLSQNQADAYSLQKEFALETLTTVAENIQGDLPDFAVHLGDAIDFHGFGFNDPPPDGSWTRKAYLDYRRTMGEVLGHTSHFFAVGNWEGENGDFSEDEIAGSREQRLLYVPGPSPGTYAEGGSVHEDYYSFTWGDALIVVLNVMTYTPTHHSLGDDHGLPDDWTLGTEQLAWLGDVLAQSVATWKLICIHHAVGGSAGDEANSAYGRGCGQAAEVGEQAVIHQWMIEHGVQAFFCGHDHAFVDMIVDGIHYALPGSAGAPWKFGADETGYPMDSTWLDSGHARINVGPDAVTVEFVDLGGTTIYEFTLD